MPLGETDIECHSRLLCLNVCSTKIEEWEMFLGEVEKCLVICLLLYHRVEHKSRSICVLLTHGTTHGQNVTFFFLSLALDFTLSNCGE